MSELVPQLPATSSVIDPASHIPLAAIAYSTPVVARQPGILIAVGVVSIVLACLSAITCLITGMEVFGIYMITKAMPQITQAAQPAAFAPLTPAQVSQTVASVQSSAPKGLNPAQLQALTAALQAPNQHLIGQRSGWSRSTSQDSTGTVTIGIGHGASQGGTMLTITPAGQTFSTPLGGFPASPFAKMHINSFIVAMVVAEDVGSFGLAIYLFVAGILLLRGSPGSRKRHLRYAAIKICFAVVAGIFSSMLVFEFFAGLPVRGNSPGLAVVRVVAVVSLVSMSYPVALLFAMNSKEVRRHYAEAK